MTPSPRRRVLVLLAVAAVLAGAIALDHATEPVPLRQVAAVGRDEPHAAGDKALTSSWFCPGGPGGSSPYLSGVGVLNTGAERAKGTVTIFHPAGPPVARQIDVPPQTTLSLHLNEMAPGDWVSAVVDVDGGDVVVEQYVASPQDNDTAPCSATASDHWYFASGSTAKDAALSLALFNPFPDDAIVDLSFATSEGRRVPGDFQGIVVAARTVRVVDVGAHVRREDAVSTEVKARAGRVVAGQFLNRSAPGLAGISLTLGAPSLGESWYFPDGLASPTVNEHYEIYNPTTSEAQVDVTLFLDEGDAEPFELTIPAQDRLTLNLNQESRVPKGVAHGAVAESVNGVGVVVERVFESAAPRAGRADTLGTHTPARRWGFALGSTGPASDEWIVVLNPGEQPATVSITGLVDHRTLDIEGVQGIVVPAGRRMAFRLSDHIKRDTLPVVVSSSRPVVVERSLYGVGRPGLSASPGVPLD